MFDESTSAQTTDAVKGQTVLQKYLANNHVTFNNQENTTKPSANVSSLKNHTNHIKSANLSDTKSPSKLPIGIQHQQKLKNTSPKDFAKKAPQTPQPPIQPARSSLETNKQVFESNEASSDEEKLFHMNK